jgi:hypothetical protein
MNSCRSSLHIFLSPSKSFLKHFILFLLLLATFCAQSQQKLIKKADESTTEFVERINESDSRNRPVPLSVKIIRTELGYLFTGAFETDENLEDSPPAILSIDKWSSAGKILIFFQTLYPSDTREIVVARSLITRDNQHFKLFTIDSFFLDRTEFPEVSEVFLANCDGDTARELFILWKSEYIHHGDAGYIWRTSVYDTPGKNLKAWKKLEGPGNWFDYANVGPIGGDEDEEKVDSSQQLSATPIIPLKEQYDNAATIINKLKEMGYR